MGFLFRSHIKTKLPNFYLLIYDDKCLMCNNFIFYLEKFYRNKSVTIHVFPSIEKAIKFSISKFQNEYFLNKLISHQNILKEISKSTILLIDRENTLISSDAILRLMIISKNIYLSLLGKLILFLVIPKIRNAVYFYIARNRLKLSYFFKKKCHYKFHNLKLHN